MVCFGVWDRDNFDDECLGEGEHRVLVPHKQLRRSSVLRDPNPNPNPKTRTPQPDIPAPQAPEDPLNAPPPRNCATT